MVGESLELGLGTLLLPSQPQHEVYWAVLLGQVFFLFSFHFLNIELLLKEHLTSCAV